VNRIPLSPGSNGIVINVIDETSRANGSRYGGVLGYWVDEGTAPTATRPKFNRIELKPKKVAALGYASDELMADAAALASVMTEAFGNELRFLVEDSIINGTGAGQPQGILNAAALVSVAKESGQVAATVVAENVIKMWARSYAPGRANSVWLINQDIEPQLAQLVLSVGTGGVPLYQSANGLADEAFGRLYGRPVIPVEYCPTLGTVGDIMLVDLSQYAYADKGGVQQASSIHVAFTTDEMAFRATYRADGQSKWKAALTPFKGTNTQTPFVALATRA
jgi:HK97 family phage major capsid protein